MNKEKKKEDAGPTTFTKLLKFRKRSDEAPIELGWKARTQKELALMEDLVPLLKRRASGREISGLSAYE